MDEIAGEIPDADLYPEDEPANIYVACETCRKAKRPNWMRFEEIPPNPVVEVIVPVILPPDQSAA